VDYAKRTLFKDPWMYDWKCNSDLPSLQWARQRLIPEIITKGNIPLNILLNGTEDEVRSEVRKVKEETQGYRHIVGLSDDVLHNTPLSNCLALVDEAKRK